MELTDRIFQHVFYSVDDERDDLSNVFLVLECECGKTVCGEKWTDVNDAEEWAGECPVARREFEARLVVEPLTFNPFKEVFGA